MSQSCPKTCSMLNLSCLTAPCSTPSPSPDQDQTLQHTYTQPGTNAMPKGSFSLSCLSAFPDTQPCPNHFASCIPILKSKHWFRGSSHYFHYHFSQTCSHMGVHRAPWTATFEERHRNKQIFFSSSWIYGWKLNYQLCNYLLLHNETHGI